MYSMYSIDIINMDTQTFIFISTASPLASSPLQTMDNHEIMQNMVADLDSNSSIKKDKVILFPTTLFWIKNTTHFKVLYV